MIIKIHKKQKEKFPEWKVIEHEHSKLLSLVETKIANEYKNSDDDIIMTIEDAANLVDKYFVPYDYIPKEVKNYIQSLVSYDL